jgi:hypothetical protein
VLNLFEHFYPGLGVGIPAIGYGVDANFGDALFFGHAQQTDEVVDVGVNAAIGTKAD